jgi:hypothetical protein
MIDEAIDAAILTALSEVPGHWRKVAQWATVWQKETQGTKLLRGALSLL